MERPAEAFSDPRERGQSERRPSPTHRGRRQLTVLLGQTIQPARFWYCHFDIPYYHIFCSIITYIYYLNDHVLIL